MPPLSGTFQKRGSKRESNLNDVVVSFAAEVCFNVYVVSGFQYFVTLGYM